MFKPEAPPLGQNLSLLREATGGQAAIFEGSGGIALLDAYRRGIAGTMPGTEIVWAIRAEWDALTAGDLGPAMALQGLIAQLVALQHGLDGFLAVEKLLLHEQGVLRNRACARPRRLSPRSGHRGRSPAPLCRPAGALPHCCRAMILSPHDSAERRLQIGRIRRCKTTVGVAGERWSRLVR